MEKLSFFIDNGWGTMLCLALRRLFRLGPFLIDNGWGHHVVLGLEVDGPLGAVLDSPNVVHHVVFALELDEDVHDGLVVCHRGIVDHEHHACEVEAEVVGDAHGHPHGWSRKKISMSMTLSVDVGA
jgi:hypothetical protein